MANGNMGDERETEGRELWKKRGRQIDKEKRRKENAHGQGGR